MTKPAIELMLDAVEWEANPDAEAQAGDLPHVTHSGVLHLMGAELRVYVLSNGEHVFDADDFEAFWGSYQLEAT